MLESKSRTGTRTALLKLCMPFLSCPTATFALQQGGFVPRELQAILQRPYLLNKKQNHNNNPKAQSKVGKKTKNNVKSANALVTLL